MPHEVTHELSNSISLELDSSFAAHILKDDEQVDLVLQGQAELRAELQRLIRAVGSISALAPVQFSASQASCLARINSKLASLHGTLAVVERRLTKIKDKLDVSNGVSGPDPRSALMFMR